VKIIRCNKDNQQPEITYWYLESFEDKRDVQFKGIMLLTLVIIFVQIIFTRSTLKT